MFVFHGYESPIDPRLYKADHCCFLLVIVVPMSFFHVKTYIILTSLIRDWPLYSQFTPHVTGIFKI